LIRTELQSGVIGAVGGFIFIHLALIGILHGWRLRFVLARAGNAKSNSKLNLKGPYAI